MRLGWLITLTLLSIFTVGAYRPFVVESGGVADPALIFLAWLALVDRWPRLLIVGFVICIYRSLGGISSAVEVVFPVAALILSVRWFRQLLDPHHRWKRLQILIPALLIASMVQEWLLAGVVPGLIFLVHGCWLSILFTALMLPVLDLAAPLLRSARYPL
ncbi:MAG: hypothetical protein VX949_11660 [Planctomycetota bacterium]|nr:hypothetical protein [Planctomycetota bacterium]